jgi:hypothetical protein
LGKYFRIRGKKMDSRLRGNDRERSGNDKEDCGNDREGKFFEKLYCNWEENEVK